MDDGAIEREFILGEVPGTTSRIVAASLFAGSYVPRLIVEEARDVAISVHVLPQWDDQGNDRQAALDLFDAFGSAEKTLQANFRGHTGVPADAAEDAQRFLARHPSMERHNAGG
ncbi:MAG TPA: hypothetical protein PLZ93_09310 [Nocardioides sp.]|uniref:hypothetical protein n=1 Tax=uncultured Nocardioides sp. TaxID=198441 RepID=UPI00261F326B|nr:hypothetical protein [uncultured Nocardioides sp.]HRI95799.1 hypothetical protein [Nocardioides sp.]HRK46792.1 hypothetical protein [Nocardioides sp.]